jgi:hypothetical protein
MNNSQLIDQTVEDVKRLSTMQKDLWRALLYVFLTLHAVAGLVWAYGSTSSTRAGITLCVVAFVFLTALQTCTHLQMGRSKKKLMQYRKEQLRAKINDDQDEECGTYVPDDAA